MTDEPTSQLTPSSATSLFYGADGLRAGWGLLFFAILLALLGFMVNFVTSRSHQQSFGHAASRGQTSDAPHQERYPAETTPASLIAAEGFSLVVVLLATFLMSRIESRPFPTYGLATPSRLPRFLQGLFWGVLCLSLLVAALRLTGFLHFDALLLHGSSALRYALLWSLGFTLVALLEETLLRGYLQYTLARGLAAIVGLISPTPHRRAYGFWAAALLLSFLFGLGHGSNPGESPVGLFAAALAGLVFCLALYRTGSLWWAIGFHASWDWAQSFLYGVADSGTMVQGHLYATHPIGKPIFSGGLTGPEGSLYVLPTLALVAAIILLTLPKTNLSPVP